MGKDILIKTLGSTDRIKHKASRGQFVDALTFRRRVADFLSGAAGVKGTPLITSVDGSTLEIFDVRLLVAIAAKESNFVPGLVNSGSTGLLQVRKHTLFTDLFQPGKVPNSVKTPLFTLAGGKHHGARFSSLMSDASYMAWFVRAERALVARYARIYFPSAGWLTDLLDNPSIEPYSAALVVNAFHHSLALFKRVIQALPSGGSVRPTYDQLFTARSSVSKTSEERSDFLKFDDAFNLASNIIDYA